MKFTTAILALAALTSAKCCSKEDEWTPKCTPEGMKQEFTQRWEKLPVGKNGKMKKVGEQATPMSDLRGLPKTCKKGVRQFDAYCHQYGIKTDNGKKEPRYADYTNDGVCDYDDDVLEQVHCLAQDCMFDYCMFRKEKFLEACIAADGNIDLPKANPGWGDVYNYNNMHGDLASNGGAEFDNGVCDEYYDLIETAEFDEAVLATFGEGDDGDGDEDDDDVY